MTGIHQAIAGGGGGPRLMTYIQKNSLTTNLNVVLDAGDRRSAQSATEQIWYDVSGNSNNYYRGASAAAGAGDPDLAGGVGVFGSTYYYCPDSATFLEFFTAVGTPSFADGWHKNGGAFTIMCIFMPVASATTNRTLFNNAGGTSGNYGIHFYLGTDLRPNLLYTWGSSGNMANQSHSTAVTQNVWNYVAISYNEATTTAFTRINGTTTANLTTIASVATANPDGTNALGRDTAGTSSYLLNDRIAAYAMWSRALSGAELASLYTDIKPFFSGMP